MNERHLIPLEEPHVATPACHCRPKPDTVFTDDGRRVAGVIWTHNSAPKRPERWH